MGCCALYRVGFALQVVVQGPQASSRCPLAQDSEVRFQGVVAILWRLGSGGRRVRFHTTHSRHHTQSTECGVGGRPTTFTCFVTPRTVRITLTFGVDSAGWSPNSADLVSVSHTSAVRVVVLTQWWPQCPVSPKVPEPGRRHKFIERTWCRGFEVFEPPAGCKGVAERLRGGGAAALHG